MGEAEFRVLVVDDEPALRRLIALVLTKHGIRCDQADNGQEALKSLERTKYDAIISDLAMPVMHGHALATEVLSRKDRPVMIIVTGVLEPRLAQDLLARGVDDIFFKPIDFQGFPLKVKVLIDRRRAAIRSLSSKPVAPGNESGHPNELQNLKPVEIDELGRKISIFAAQNPISPAFWEVYHQAKSDASISTLTAAVERDGALVAEVLRFANSSELNSQARRVTRLEDAIMRLGKKRVGELALGLGVTKSITTEKIQWLDLEWRRSISTGVALEILLEHARLVVTSEGLLFSAILHNLGRYILATLYPGHYKTLLKECTRSKSSLEDAEKRVFPLDHMAVLIRLLAEWNIAPDIYRPLAHLSTSFASLTSLTSLPSTLRGQVEMAKAAILLGQVSLGSWRDWDVIDCPTSSQTAKWLGDSIEATIDHIRWETEDIAAVHENGSRSPVSGPAAPSPLANERMKYWSSTPPARDIVLAVLASSGLETEQVSDFPQETGGPMLVNVVDGIPKTVHVRELTERGSIMLVSGRDSAQEIEGATQRLSLPCSFASLQNTCMKLTRSTTASDLPRPGIAPATTCA